MNNYSAAERLKYALKRAKGIPVNIDITEHLEFAEKVLSIDCSGMTRRQLCRLVFSGEETERFAAVCEAAVRKLGLMPFAVQLAAGRILSGNGLVQMQTGEGKTLAAVFAAVMRAAGGGRTHILTANEYLAGRDAAWMGGIYDFFGIECCAVTGDMDNRQKREAYSASVVYLTAKQSGFDYLQDCCSYSASEMVHQPFDSCIVDEADFIMIDEARIPLVIAGGSTEADENLAVYDDIASRLKRDLHFKLDRRGRKCILTPEGINTLCSELGIEETSEEGAAAVAGVNVALHARRLLERNIDYIVRNDAIELVDAFTGRTAEKREWPYGIQRALEIKEGCSLRKSGTIIGRINLSTFINLYPEKSAMTATAAESASEFYRCYGLKTFIIPPNRRVIREDLPDMIFRTAEAKLKHMTALVRECVSTARPVLIGTATVMESRLVSGLLEAEGISHRVLNAEQDADEAAVIASAGRSGAVTVATNMAGRGTDIKLGGGDPADYEKVRKKGGLFVISLNRHDSKRVDNQLRGRSGRQGDPGTTVFLLSLEDELFVKYGISEFLPDRLLSFQGNCPIRDPKAAAEIERAQQIIEDQHSKMRETLNNYSSVLESCRKGILTDRFDALIRGDFPLGIVRMLEESGSPAEGDYSDAAVIFAETADHFWSEFLGWNEELMEGIYLRRLGSKEPLHEYIHDLKREFKRGYSSMLEEAARKIIAASEGKETEAPGWRNGSTWTYLIDDNPFPSFSLNLLGMDAAVGAFAGVLLLLFSPVLLLAGISEKWTERKKENNIKKV